MTYTQPDPLAAPEVRYRKFHRRLFAVAAAVTVASAQGGSLPSQFPWRAITPARWSQSTAEPAELQGFRPRRSPTGPEVVVSGEPSGFPLLGLAEVKALAC
jgi:hypothetical protein